MPQTNLLSRANTIDTIMVPTFIEWLDKHDPDMMQEGSKLKQLIGTGVLAASTLLGGIGCQGRYCPTKPKPTQSSPSKIQDKKITGDNAGSFLPGQDNRGDFLPDKDEHPAKKYLDWLEKRDPEMHEGVVQWAKQKAMPLAAGAAAAFGGMFGGDATMPQAQAAPPTMTQPAPLPAGIKKIDQNTYEVEGKAAMPPSLGKFKAVEIGRTRAQNAAKMALMKHLNVKESQIRAEQIKGTEVGGNYVVIMKIIILK